MHVDITPLAFLFITFDINHYLSAYLQIQQVRSQLGAFAAPDHIQWAPGLPKTRSGKVMRRILRKVAAAGKDVKPEELGDTTTLAEPEVVQELIASHVFNN